MNSKTMVPEKTGVSGNEKDSLQQFAAFIRVHKLDEFIRQEIELFVTYDLPLLKYINNLSEEERFALIKESGERFLLALEQNRYEEYTSENYAKWEKNEIAYFDKQVISLQDILTAHSAQKIALLQFIPAFTQNLKNSVEIATRLELIYQRAQLSAVAILEKLKKEDELKLRESEERYKDLFDNASDLIYMVTVEGKLIYVNNAWKQTLGYTEEELKGESIYFFVCSKDRERFRSYRNKILEGNQPEMIRISFLSKDNREIIAEGAVSAKTKDGKPEYTRGIFRDVTRRVLNEDKLQFYTQQVLEREEKIKHLIQSAPDAIIVINEAGIINIWNPKAEEIFGWKAEEVVGIELAETIIPPKFREAHSNGMKRLLHTGEVRILNKTIEVTAMKKDGSEFFVSLTISRASLPQESLFIAFIRDISEQKKNELELEQHRIQLERTNSELEQYAWVTSHDLKEPLRKIRTFSDMLLKMNNENFTEDALTRLKKIHESAERMDKLIEAILMYSHSSADYAFEEVNLDAILKEVISDLEFAISSKHANIYIDELPVVRGIPFQLRQLFQNLISNALKYNKPDLTPVIEIRYSKENDRHVIMIKDNGIGFNEEFAGKIFQVFQRLVGKHEYEGTGIGLALCKKIVENHCGTIEAFSAEGIGSSFVVCLPVHHS